MLPRAIDENKMNPTSGEVILSLDMAKPPTKEIPIAEFPRVVYKHPKEPYVLVEHRNNMHAVVHTEMVPAEHKTRLVQNKSELAEAMKDGWVKEPYIPKAAPEPTADLY